MKKKSFLLPIFISFSLIIAVPLNAAEWGKSFASQVDTKVDEATRKTQEITAKLRTTHQNALHAIAQLKEGFPHNPTASSTNSLINYPKTAQTVAQKIQNDLHWAVINFINNIDDRNFTQAVKKELTTFITTTYKEDFRKVFASTHAGLGIAKKAFEDIAIDALNLIHDKSGATRAPRSTGHTQPTETIKHLHDSISQEPSTLKKPQIQPTETIKHLHDSISQEPSTLKKPQIQPTETIKHLHDSISQEPSTLKKPQIPRGKRKKPTTKRQKGANAQQKKLEDEAAKKKLEDEAAKKKLEDEAAQKKLEDEAAQTNKLKNPTKKTKTTRKKPTRGKKALTLEDKINNQLNTFAEDTFPTVSLDQLTLMNETYELFGNFDRDDTKAQGARFEKALNKVLDKITNISALKTAHELITKADKQQKALTGPPTKQALLGDLTAALNKKKQPSKKKKAAQEPAKKVLADIQTSITKLDRQTGRKNNYKTSTQTTAQQIYDAITTCVKQQQEMLFKEEALEKFMKRFTQMICPRLHNTGTCLCPGQKHHTQSITEKLRNLYRQKNDTAKKELLKGALKYAWGQDYLNIKQTLNQLS